MISQIFQISKSILKLSVPWVFSPIKYFDNPSFKLFLKIQGNGVKSQVFLV